MLEDICARSNESTWDSGKEKQRGKESDRDMMTIRGLNYDI